MVDYVWVPPSRRGEIRYVLAPWLELVTLEGTGPTIRRRATGAAVPVTPEERELLERAASAQGVVLDAGAARIAERLEARELLVHYADLMTGAVSVVEHVAAVKSPRISEWTIRRPMTLVTPMLWSRVSKALHSPTGIRLRVGRAARKASRRRVVHVIYEPPWGSNRGDAVMSLALRVAAREAGVSIATTPIIANAFRRPNLEKELRSAVDRHDLVVIGGGGLFMPKFRWDGLEPFLKGRPYMLYGVGYNRNWGREAERDPEFIATLQRVVRGSSACSVRDQHTVDFIDEISGVKSKLICDPGVVYASTFARSTRRPGPLRIGLNLPFHGLDRQFEIMATCLPALRALIEKLVARGVSVTYFRHTPWEEYLINELRGLPVTICRAPLPQLVREYAKMDLLLAGMLHSAVFSFGAGVPFISISYDQKQREFVSMVGDGASELPIHEVNEERLDSAVDAALESVAEDRVRLRQRRDTMIDEHLEFLREAL